jgi:2-methylcitrate dehydratase
MNLAEQLSQYALSLSYEDLSPEVIHKVKQRLVDTIGCALGSHDEHLMADLRAFAGTQPLASATILGTAQKTSVEMATFVNGCMIRYYDFNDGYIAKELGHPSDNIATCLAVGEAHGVTGRELILAIVLAYEIQCRLQDAANLYRLGWDHVNYVLIASTVAAGRLMKLNQAQLAHAINIAVNGHIALRQVRAGELSAWKGCSAANAARNAVFSASLARHGVTGPSPIFEGEMGFMRQITGEFQLDVSQFGNARNGDFRILETLTKLLPMQGEMQTAVWAALELRQELVDLSQVRSVRIDTTEVGFRILGKDPQKWRPTSRETADHSLPYAVARALLDGQISTSSFAVERLGESEVLDLMQKITVHASEELTALFPALIPNRVTLVLESGQTLSRQVNAARGTLDTPMTDNDFEDKFRMLLSPLFVTERIAELQECLWGLEEQDKLVGLFELMTIYPKDNEFL